MTEIVIMAGIWYDISGMIGLCFLQYFLVRVGFGY